MIKFGWFSVCCLNVECKLQIYLRWAIKYVCVPNRISYFFSLLFEHGLKHSGMSSMKILKILLLLTNAKNNAVKINNESFKIGCILCVHRSIFNTQCSAPLIADQNPFNSFLLNYLLLFFIILTLWNSIQLKITKCNIMLL